jgi:hypothetical protein
MLVAVPPELLVGLVWTLECHDASRTRPIGPYTSAVPLPRNDATQDEGPAVQGRRTHPWRGKRCEAEDSRGRRLSEVRHAEAVCR